MKRRSQKKDMIKKQIEYWTESTDRNWKTAQDLFLLKHYDACLFFCHLTLEKLLKAIIVTNTRKPAPFSHDLAKLAVSSELSPDLETVNQLRTISTFNTSGRYDDAKLEFYKKCTRPFTIHYLAISETIRLWLKKSFPKK